MRLLLVNVLVPWPSPLDSPSASFRRSTPLPSWSRREVEDDRWDPSVSDCVVQNGIFLFSEMNDSVCFCYFYVDLFRAPKIMKIFV